jgi:hypothetical protein
MALLGRLVDGAGRVEGRIVWMVEAHNPHGHGVEKPSHLLVGIGKKKIGELWRDSDLEGKKRWHGTLLGRGITAQEGRGVIEIHGNFVETEKGKKV